MRATLLMMLSLLSSCLFDTSRNVPFRADDGTMPVADMELADDVDAAPPDLTEVDLYDGPLYPRDSLPRGTTCDGVPTDPPMYSCNPVLQDCGHGDICEIQILADGFSTRCRKPGPGETFLVPDGAACDASSMTQRCRLGAKCLNETCHAMCEFADAVGCRSTEMCDTIDDAPGPGGDVLEGYGACFDSCR